MDSGQPNVAGSSLNSVQDKGNLPMQKQSHKSIEGVYDHISYSVE